jgi:hypothetical protein
MHTNDEILQHDLNTTYSLLLENIIYQYLTVCKDYNIKRPLTLNDLMRWTGLVNKNYNVAKYNSKLIQDMFNNNYLTTKNNEIVLDSDITDFIYRTEHNYRQKIKSTLVSMEQSEIISYNESLYYIKYVNGHYKSFDPTDDEISDFIDIGYNILHNKIKVKYKSDMNRSQRFCYNKLLLSEVRKKLGWSYYSYKYTIIAGTGALRENLNANIEQLREKLNDKSIQTASKQDVFRYLIDWFIDADCDFDIQEKIKDYIEMKDN